MTDRLCAAAHLHICIKVCEGLPATAADVAEAALAAAAYAHVLRVVELEAPTRWDEEHLFIAAAAARRAAVAAACCAATATVVARGRPPHLDAVSARLEALTQDTHHLHVD